MTADEAGARKPHPAPFLHACKALAVAPAEATVIGDSANDAEGARAAGCRRVWLVTSNDNLPALKFYQRRGYELVAVHRRAIDAARALKPEIAPTGLYGLPVRDEIELEIGV